MSALLGAALFFLLMNAGCSPTKETGKTSLAGTWIKVHDQRESLDGTILSSDTINNDFLQVLSISEKGVGQHLLPNGCNGFVLFYTMKITADSLFWSPDSMMDSKKSVHLLDVENGRYHGVDYITGVGKMSGGLRMLSEKEFMEVRKSSGIIKITWKRIDERAANLADELKDPSAGDCF